MLVKSVLLAIVIATAVAAEGNPESDPCTPKSVFYEKCNRCVCAQDGSGAVCTRKSCSPGVYNDDGTLKEPLNAKSKRSVDDDVIVVAEEPKTCEVGKKYKVDCNYCACTISGLRMCTKKRCIHNPQKRSVEEQLPELPENGCEPGVRYRKECNTCICGTQGFAACTLKICVPNDTHHAIVTRNVENWGPLYNFGDPCEPGQNFYSQCNLCRCGRDGKSAVCTLKACQPPSEK